MDELLVVSRDPELAETLRFELAEYRVAEVSPGDLPALNSGRFRLILADAGADIAAADAAVIRLQRPIRLRDLLYTIRARLQGKTAASEAALSRTCAFLPAERALKSASGAKRIALTEKEAELLACLVEARGAVVARDALLKRVWGYSDDIATHTLETHIYRLRGKLRQADRMLDVALSEEGGYRLTN